MPSPVGRDLPLHRGEPLQAPGGFQFRLPLRPGDELAFIPGRLSLDALLQGVALLPFGFDFMSDGVQMRR